MIEDPIPPTIKVNGLELPVALCPTCGTRCYPAEVVAICMARHKRINDRLRADGPKRKKGDGWRGPPKPYPTRKKTIEFNEYVTDRTYYWG